MSKEVGNVGDEAEPAREVRGSLGLLAAMLAHWLRGPGEASGFLMRTVFAARCPIVLAKWRLEGLSGSRTTVYQSRWKLLEAAVKCARPDGLNLEFGVYKGESINFLADRIPSLWHGFDSFEGLPRPWTPGFAKGALDAGGVLPPIRGNVRLWKGWFSETLPKFVESVKEKRISFLHIDSDLYESARLIFTFLGDRIAEGTVIVFDEYTGVTPDDEARAFREWRRRTGARFRCFGCSLEGSIGVQVCDRELADS